MLPNKLPFTRMRACRTYASASVKSYSRRRRHWRLLLVRNLSESHARHARIPSQTKERPYSARGSVPTSSSEFAADWTCGFARFRTLKYPAGIPIPHFCARAGALPLGKAEAATAGQSSIEIKAFGTRPGRTCGSDRFRTLKCPAGISIPNFCARAGAVAARQSRGGNCEPGLDRSGTACPSGPLRQFLTYPIPREERE